MKITKVFLGVAMIGLVASVAGAANSLDVNASAAAAGTNYGLEVIFDGSGTVAKVVDDTPVDETVYRAEFWFHPNSCYMGGTGSTGHWFSFMRATDSATFRSSFQLLLTNKFNLYRLSGRAGTNSAGVFKITGRINLDPTAWHKIRVELTNSPAAGTPGGDLVITVLEGPQAGQSVSASAFSGGVGINNSTITADDLHMGAVGNVDPLITGSMYFDEFASFRTLAP